MTRTILGDCMTEMGSIKDGSVDLILTDPPYSITSNKWDVPFDFPGFWKESRRILSERGTVAMTASQPFTSLAVCSNPEWFRHEWIWIKNRGSNFANTVREPMKEHESVLIFSPGKWTYNRQMQERSGMGKDRVRYGVAFRSRSENYRDFEGRDHSILPEMRVPSSWQKFNTEVGLHPTQKPVPLMEYLVRTYSNEGDTVLDPFMGSGTTGVACRNLGRDFIGIEMDERYYNMARERLTDLFNLY